MLLIRRIQLGEAELFRSIRLAALREAPRAFGSTYESALRRTPESWCEQADSTACGSDRSTFLAFSDELPIGIVALYRLRRGSDAGELMQMWIAPEYRGRGIAKRMMDIAFQWAGNNQFRAIVVKVARNNARALRLYREYGFALAKRALSNHPDEWSDLPAGTRELALLFENITPETKEPFVQWLVYKIPSDEGGLPEGYKHKADPKEPVNVLHGRNSLGNIGYDGPLGTLNRPIRYRFRLLALDQPLELPPGLDKAAFLAAASDHVIEQSDLVASYERRP